MKMTFYRPWCVFTIVICLPIIFGTGEAAATVLDIGPVRLGETKLLTFYLPNATIGDVDSTSAALQVLDEDCETPLTTFAGTLVEAETEPWYAYNVCVTALSPDAGRYDLYENITLEETALYHTIRVLVTQPLVFDGPTSARVIQGGDALVIEGNISDTYDVRQYGVQIVVPPARGQLTRDEGVITIDEDETVTFPISYSVSPSTGAVSDSFVFFVYPLSNKTLRSSNVTFEIDIDVKPKITSAVAVSGVLRKVIQTLNVKITNVKSDEYVRLTSIQDEGDKIGFLYVPNWKYPDFTNRAGFVMLVCEDSPEFPLCPELSVEGFANDVKEFAGNLSFVAALSGEISIVHTVTNLNSTNTTISSSTARTTVQIVEDSPVTSLWDSLAGTVAVILGAISVFGAICMVVLAACHNLLRTDSVTSKKST